jgi:hypothetical protein
LLHEHASRHRRFQEHRAKWELTNLRPGFSPAVDLQAFISKCGEQLPPLNEVIRPQFL